MANHIHRVHRSGWLRAAVMGANDGIVSTASLIMGVAAAGMATQQILLTGIAGLVAGATSMAAGEFVSVSSQADTEKADLDLERRELARDPDYEHQEMTNIYVERGLDTKLAAEVARQLMDFDALGSHARDELGISPASHPRPILAALTSAGTFSVGAALPLAMVLLTPAQNLLWVVAIASLVFLALLGILSAHMGGAPKFRAAVRVTFWSALAMVLTSVVGRWFGVDIAG